MTDKEKNGWIRFVPSLDLPKEHVSIAYDTHDERGVRYAYGYFQFYNGTCGCFWKDGNEQPKVVKAEDIKYWMSVPPLDVQEEPVSDDLEEAAINYMKSQNPPIWGLYDGFIAGGKWMNKKLCSEIERRLNYIEFQCHRADTYKELKSLLAYIKSYV